MEYHVVTFFFNWRNSFTDQTGFSNPSGLVAHEVLLALIQGGEPAQKSYLASHTDFDLDEISNVTIYYDLSKRYTKEGKSLDGGKDYVPLDSRKKSTPSSTPPRPSQASSGSSASTSSTPSRTPSKQDTPKSSPKEEPRKSKKKERPTSKKASQEDDKEKKGCLSRAFNIFGWFCIIFVIITTILSVIMGS